MAPTVRRHRRNTIASPAILDIQRCTQLPAVGAGKPVVYTA